MTTFDIESYKSTLITHFSERRSITDKLVKSVSDHSQLYSKYRQIVAQNDTLKKENLSLASIKGKALEECEISSKLEEVQKDLNSQLKRNSTQAEELQTAMKDNLTFKTENDKLKQTVAELESQNKTLIEQKVAFTKSIENLNEQLEYFQTEHHLLEKNYLRLREDFDTKEKENENLLSQLIKLKSDYGNKLNEALLMHEDAKKKMQTAETLFATRQEKFEEESSKTASEFEKFRLLNNKEIKIPNKLKFKRSMHKKEISSILFTPMGNNFITAGVDSMIRFFEAGKVSEVGTFPGFASAVSAVDMDAAEQYLFASSYDKCSKLWDLKQNRFKATLTGHMDVVNCNKIFHARPAGLTGASDRSIKEWDFISCTQVNNIGCNSSCFSLDISKDDSQIVSGHHDGAVRFWSGQGAKKPDFILENVSFEKISTVKFTNDGYSVVCSSADGIRLIDLRKMAVTMSRDSGSLGGKLSTQVNISSDGKYACYGTVGSEIRVLNMETFDTLPPIDKLRMGYPTAISWRPFNSEIYVGDSTGKLTHYINK